MYELHLPAFLNKSLDYHIADPLIRQFQLTFNFIYSTSLTYRNRHSFVKLQCRFNQKELWAMCLRQRQLLELLCFCSCTNILITLAGNHFFFTSKRITVATPLWLGILAWLSFVPAAISLTMVTTNTGACWEIHLHAIYILTTATEIQLAWIIHTPWLYAYKST